MDPDEEFEFDGQATPSEAADTLAQIAEGVRTGSVSLAVGSNEITIFPDGRLAVRIRARKKKSRTAIDIDLARTHPRVKSH
jgi:amphi-Trp domain-containing protein